MGWLIGHIGLGSQQWHWDDDETAASMDLSLLLVAFCTTGIPHWEISQWGIFYVLVMFVQVEVWIPTCCFNQQYGDFHFSEYFSNSKMCHDLALYDSPASISSFEPMNKITKIGLDRWISAIGLESQNPSQVKQLPNQDKGISDLSADGCHGDAISWACNGSLAAL